METKYIAAIEIASSKIKGAIGTVDADGRLMILAVEEMPALDNVHYGRVQNIREVSAAVNEIARRLEASPMISPRKINSLAVSIGGRSLACANTKSSAKFNDSIEITEQHVKRLIYDARRNYVSEKNQVLEIIPLMFSVNNLAVRQPVGTFSDSLRADLLLITCGRETRQNLERVKFETVDQENVSYIVSTKALADFVLTPDEKELGTALVDVGAATTSVAVYKDGNIAFLCTIPMGSRLLTLDIVAGIGTTEEAAEKLKYDLSEGTAEENLIAQNYISSRAGEIIANVINQLNIAGFEGISKIVLCGGGAKSPEFEKQLAAQSKATIRSAEMPDDIIFRITGRNNADNLGIVALIAAASKTFASSCLTDVETEKPIMIVDDTPEDTILDTLSPVSEQTPLKERDNYEIRQSVDDDDILQDDPDDIEVNEDNDDKTTKKSKSKFTFPWSKNKAKNEPEPEEEEESEPEQEEEEEEENETLGKAKNIFNRFATIFKPIEGFEEDEFEEENDKDK